MTLLMTPTTTSHSSTGVDRRSEHVHLRDETDGRRYARERQEREGQGRRQVRGPFRHAGVVRDRVAVYAVRDRNDDRECRHVHDSVAGEIEQHARRTEVEFIPSRPRGDRRKSD